MEAEALPTGEAATDEEIAALVALLQHRRIAVLTGAGCSTESGIPDYRGPGTRARARNPMSWAEFSKSEATRRRYWARAKIGWERVSGARPNAAHRAIAELERRGLALGVVTQNVDGLHADAGSKRVVELHGALARTRCVECGGHEARRDVQARLRDTNPAFSALDAAMMPDGDAALDDDVVATFSPPLCRACGSVLRPDVVLFGESVPKPVVEAAFDIVDAATVLLVVGTSLAVYSGYRFLRRARERGIPVAIVNVGPCRGEEIATVRLAARAAATLEATVRGLS